MPFSNPDFKQVLCSVARPLCGSWISCFKWLLMGGLLHYSEEGPWRLRPPPSLLLTIPNVAAHPSTASVPITVLLICYMMVRCSALLMWWLKC